MRYPWILLLLCVVIAAGCVKLSKPYQATSFYTLEYEAPAANGQEVLPVSLRVGRLEIAPEFDANRMVYRDSAFTRNSFLHQRWRAHPKDMVRFFLARDLRAAASFQDVVSATNGLDTEYLLEGMVEEFLLSRNGDGWEAVLRVNIVLRTEKMSADRDDLFFQKSFVVTVPSRDNTSQGFAEAMSLAMRELSRLVQVEVRERVRSHQT